ncbi:filamentous hemagglutinin N-terminal domain-containing protein [Phormidesmis sp. 146-12]
MDLKRYFVLLGLTLLSLGIEQERVRSQIVPEAGQDGTGTVVTPNVQNTNQLDITGGASAGSNLFHSFQDFGVNQNQTANFVPSANIQNILGRVVGGNPSIVNGIIQVSGGTANLYLMNPAGILFGSGASLNVPGSFVATTANGMRFGANGWFSAVGANSYGALTGNPDAFAFTMANPGALVADDSSLRLKNPGQSIVLLGGAVVTTGTLEAPGGNITIAAVPGNKFVQIRQAGSLLSIELPIEERTAINALPVTFIPATLPQLITGGSSVSNASRLRVTNGVIRLTTVNSSTEVSQKPGDATVSSSLNAENGNIHLASDGNLLLADGSLESNEVRIEAQNGNLIAEARFNSSTFFRVAEGTTFSGRDISLSNGTGSFGGFSRNSFGRNFKIIATGDVSLGAGSSRVQDALVIPGDFTIQAGGKLNIERYHVLARNIRTETDSVKITGSELSAENDLQLISRGSVEISEIPKTGSVLPAPAILQAKGKLSISGNQGINIQALTAPESLLLSRGNLTLNSPAPIIGNIKIASGGNFTAGTGSFTQSNSSGSRTGIISSSGDVTFDKYEGAALKIEAKGSIRGGNIRIIGAGNFPVTINDPDLLFLNAGSGVVLRAGVSELKNFPDLPSALGGGQFSESTRSASPPSISVGNIDTSVTEGNGGAVVLTAPGDINVGNIISTTTFNSSQSSNTLRKILPIGGSVSVNSGGNVRLGNLNTRGGTVAIAGESILAGDVSAGSLGSEYTRQELSPTLGKVELVSREGNIEVRTITASIGGIDVNAAKLFRVTGIDSLQSRAVLATPFLELYRNEGTFKIKEAPIEVINFLVSQGYRQEDLKISDAKVSIFRAASPFNRQLGSSISEGIPVSISVQNFGRKTEGKVTIRHGGTNEADITRPLVEISGKKGGESGFVVGLREIAKPGPVFQVDINQTSNSFDPKNPKSSISLIRNIDIEPLAEIPSDSSGLAGLLFIGNSSNGLYADSIQTIASRSKGGGTGGTGGPRGGDIKVSKDIDRQTAQKPDTFICKPVNQTGSQTSSKNSPSTAPCSPAGNDGVILKLLDDKQAATPRPAPPETIPVKN